MPQSDTELLQFYSKSTETKLKAGLYGVKLAKGANPVKLQDDIQRIMAKFLRAGLPCPHSDITGTEMKALAVEYQAAINNANIKCKIHGTQLSLELLISKARRMYKMCGLGQEGRAEQKKPEVAAAVAGASGDQKCFK